MVTCLASRHTRPNVWVYDSAADTYICNDPKRAKKGGVYHNQRLNRLKTEDGTPICKTSDDTGITLILGYQNKSIYEDQTSPRLPFASTSDSLQHHYEAYIAYTGGI
ncbi:uncharacterized protein N7477_008048 [Penicillium maclennaniae]|uniref:uncharacterized protein n=1 Tax=Penicillium maclennaniae TaxID=1343394 RepID=UPI00253FCEE1|nr:uncharacterized protein N7477_008048 [Penicillium maclennaniae]KAJ5665600.1 hypothetical protein N7477_008048 [Penicillium maclennaniae]